MDEDLWTTERCPADLPDHELASHYSGPISPELWVDVKGVAGGRDYRIWFTHVAPDQDGAVLSYYLAALDAEASSWGTEVHTSTSARLPDDWPVSIGTRSHPHQLLAPVTWWAAPASPATTHWAQHPDPFEPCNNGWAQGTAVTQQGEDIYVLGWGIQHYFPMGGCGG